jgi:penicillin-binding protein 2
MKEHLEYAEKARTERRTAVVRAVFATAFVGYLLTLWYHQTLQGAEYRLQADNNILRTQEVPAYRGNILDRHDRVLVKNRLSFNVLLHREILRDLDRVVSFLAEVLDLPPETIRGRIEASRHRPAHEPVVIEEDVAMAQAVSIEARRVEWPELSIAVTSRRDYPERRLAAHVVGYVGEISEEEIRSGEFQADLRGGDIVGKTGVERVYEVELQGSKGFKTVLINSRGRVVEELGVERRPEHGKDVVLTLDADLQRALEEGLEGQVGAGIFLDPEGGEILAMASSPAFEPDLFSRRFPPREWQALIADPLKPLQNRASLSRYSPGSTFKIIVAAAALEERIVTPSTTVYCPGYAIIYGHRFRCHNAAGHGEVDLEKAIVHSCNVYFYNVGKNLGIERIAAYARRMGLGVETGIDLLYEDPGLIPTPEWKRRERGQPWYAGETISVSIGQGPLSVTPLQMARLAASLANGGRQIIPHLRRSADDGKRLAVARTPEAAGFSETTRRALRRAMTGVVNRGTGHRTRLPGIQVAAKTGTAQFSARSAGVDADELPYAIRDHAWLVGYAPAEDPQIAFAIFIEHGGHGGTTAAPVARRVLERFFDRDGAPGAAVETARAWEPESPAEGSDAAAH